MFNFYQIKVNKHKTISINKVILLKFLVRVCKKVKLEAFKKLLSLEFVARMCKKVKFEKLKKASPKSCLVGCPSKRFCGLKALL